MKKSNYRRKSSNTEVKEEVFKMKKDKEKEEIIQKKPRFALTPGLSGKWWWMGELWGCVMEPVNIPPDSYQRIKNNKERNTRNLTRFSQLVCMS